jgi:hypothetical protein
MMRATEADFSLSELERYLCKHIPMASVLGVNVRQASLDSVIVGAPLSRNLNHRGTVFGGSASAVAILAGWLLLDVRLRTTGVAPNFGLEEACGNCEMGLGSFFCKLSDGLGPGKSKAFCRLSIARTIGGYRHNFGADDQGVTDCG